MSSQIAPAPEAQRQVDFYARTVFWLQKNLSAFALETTWSGNIEKSDVDICTCRSPGIYVDIGRDRATNLYIDVFVGVWPLQQGVVHYRRIISTPENLIKADEEYAALLCSQALACFKQPKTDLPIKDDPAMKLVEGLLQYLKYLVTQMGR